jgi:hypothetical protein
MPFVVTVVTSPEAWAARRSWASPGYNKGSPPDTDITLYPMAAASATTPSSRSISNCSDTAGPESE